MARPELLEVIRRELSISIAILSASASIKASPSTEVQTG